MCAFYVRESEWTTPFVRWCRLFPRVYPGFGGSAAWNTVPGSRPPPPGFESSFREYPVFRPCVSTVWLVYQPLPLENRACSPALGGKAHFAFWLTPGRRLRVRPGVTLVRRLRLHQPCLGECSAFLLSARDTGKPATRSVNRDLPFQSDKSGQCLHLRFDAFA